MPEKKRIVQVLAHPRVVKLISILTALCIIATFAINGVVMYAAYKLDWGFANSPSRFQPTIVPHINSTAISVSIPVYVNNSASFGFPVDALSFEIGIRNSSGLITNSISNAGKIPWGTNKTFNVTLIDAHLSDLPSLNTTSTLYFDILFHVTYTFTTVTVSVTIEKIGGMSI